MRLAYYAGASTAAAAACLLKAFHERPNFYSATVYLSQSNACLLILTNLLLPKIKRSPRNTHNPKSRNLHKQATPTLRAPNTI